MPAKFLECLRSSPQSAGLSAVLGFGFSGSFVQSSHPQALFVARCSCLLLVLLVYLLLHMFYFKHYHIVVSSCMATICATLMLYTKLCNLMCSTCYILKGFVRVAIGKVLCLLSNSPLHPKPKALDPKPNSPNPKPLHLQP